MRVSRGEEYGVRLVMDLATGPGQLTVRELATREGLPEPTVAKVVARLRRAGLVAAARGRRGGYSLTVPADRLTLDGVVRAMAGGDSRPGFCTRTGPGGGPCVHTSHCGLRPVWLGLERAIGSFLARVTVADVVAASAALPSEPAAAARA